MKSFKFLFKISVLSSLLFCTIEAQATIWSTCQTVTSVTEARGSTINGIIISTFPGVTKSDGKPCNAWMGEGSLRVGIGVQGQTADSVKGALTLATTAYLTGKKVIFRYDDTTGTCDVQYIGLGGYIGNCK